jgi:hypothetical protein
MFIEEDIDKLVEKAKKLVTHQISHPKVIADYESRRWLETNVDSYQAGTNRISFLVLEGSPPRGYVVVNYSTKKVTAFDSADRVLKRFRTLL